MITCQKCGKENQEHYRFCLGCGAELPRASPGAADRGTEAGLAAEAVQRPPRPNVPSPPVALPPDSRVSENTVCPQCSHVNSPGNRFCASCGYKLNRESLPQRPARPSPAKEASSVEFAPITLTALRADGSEAGSFEVPSGPTAIVGRDTQSVFAGDSYLSPQHAVFSRRGGGVFVGDAASLNGVYIRIPAHTPWPLSFGDVFRIGQEILRLESLETPEQSEDGVKRLGSPTPRSVARLGLVIGRDTTGNAFLLPYAGVHLGRERGDVLFPEDGYVSGLHCRLSVSEDEQITLTDLGSSNGSFVRLKHEHALSDGDVLLMGQQLFRVDL